MQQPSRTGASASSTAPSAGTVPAAPIARIVSRNAIAKTRRTGRPSQSSPTSDASKPAVKYLSPPMKHIDITNKQLNADRAALKKVKCAITYPKITVTPKDRAYNYSTENGYRTDDAARICFVCQRSTDEALIQCHGQLNDNKVTRCHTRFHPSCAATYNADSFNMRYAGAKECANGLLCPLHVCAGCQVEHCCQTAYAGSMIECAKCFRAFHPETCMPAGYQSINIRTMVNGEEKVIEKILCPAHCENETEKHENINACYICEEHDKELLECEDCAQGFHADCREIKTVDGNEAPGTKCEFCTTKSSFCLDHPVLVKEGAVWKPAIGRKWSHVTATKARSLPNFGRHGFMLIELKRKFRVVRFKSAVPLLAITLRYRINGGRSQERVWERILLKCEEEKKTLLKLRPAIVRTIKKCTNARLESYEETTMDTGLCACTGENRCTTDFCKYRAEGSECPPNCAKEGRTCNNRKIANGEQNPKVEVKETGDTGYGVFATQRISEGEFIFAYIGEIISEKEKDARMEMKKLDSQARHYIIKLDENFHVDAATAGNDARYVNHGCVPNTHVRRMDVFYDVADKKSVKRAYFVACKDIEAGEELKFNYRFTCGKEASVMACLCGAKECGGTLAGTTKAKIDALSKQKNKKVKKIAGKKNMKARKAAQKKAIKKK